MQIPKSVTDLLRIAAPTLLSAFLGPLGGVAASIAAPLLDRWLGQVTKPDEPNSLPALPNNPSTVMATIEANLGDPELLERLKKVEKALQNYEEDQKIKFAELEYKDKENIRKFQADTGTAHALVKWGMGIVVLSMLVQFFAIAGSILLIAGIFKIPYETASMAAGVFGLIGTIVGYIAGYATQIIGFYWGGSKGRADENNALQDALQQSGEQLGQAAETAAKVAQAAADKTPTAPPVVVLPSPVPSPVAPVPAPVAGDWKQGPFGGARWRLTHAGVQVEGDAGIARTVGEPVTVRRAWKLYGDLVRQIATREGIPAEIALMVLCTESGSKLAADGAFNEKDGRVSGGVMQVLTGTATQVMGRSITLEELFKPEISIEAGIKYIKSQKDKTWFDPILTAAAYNAGGLYAPRDQDKNRFNLRTTGDHLERAIRWYGDICFVRDQDGWFKE
jgi:hypothetical protein